MRKIVVAVLVVGTWLAAAVPARAADPGRWRLTGTTSLPIVYYQGVTVDPARNLYFDGVYVGLYRTDPAFHETGRTDDVIPPDVHAREGYNHIGDIDWDGAEGGRVLLPLECYVPGGPNGGNPCLHGSIGVAGPGSLQWRYSVKLDPAEIPKAMWAEVSPDGALLWTSSGADLLAYRTADITRGAGPIAAVRRLAGAVPPSGITGAAFYGERLLLAGQADTRFQVWSVDLATGARQLEIERTLVGESEGLAMVDALGGVLHWIVTPLDAAGRPPTYPPPGNALLHFVPSGPRPRMQAAVNPRLLVRGRRTGVSVAVASRGAPVAGADVRVAGQAKRTTAAGTTSLSLRFRRLGRHRIRITRADLRPRTVSVRVI